MIVFLLKSSACLAIFLMFYKLFLEKECMHTFKRYYLLVALVLALVIPSITFTEYVEVIPATAMIAPMDMISTETAMAIRENTAAQEVNKTGIDYWPLVLWTLYGLGVLLFSLKFLFNLQKIGRNIRNNPKLKIDSIINVLLRDAIVPHTFLNYIFLNRQKFESHEIPKDVLVHEATHARQKHSLDVLFVELLQIVFWFNPLIHLTKKSIKLNHEFLADAAVLKQGSLTVDYQNTLLTFASSANYKSNQPSMANAINYSSYSSIKKRFTVMKTRTSKKSILVKSLLVLPLFALLLYGFSDTQTVENKQVHVKIQNENKKSVQKVEKNAQNNEIITVHINKKGQLLIHDELVELENLASFLSKMNSDLSKEEGKKVVRAKIIPDNSVPKDIIVEIENILKEYGVAQIDVVEGQVPFLASSQKGATKEQISKYNALAKKYNAQPKEKRVIPSGDLKSLETIYDKMTNEQKTDALPFPECPDPKSSNQEGATKKQVGEYNGLAKTYNKMLASNGNIRIKKSDVDRLEYLHDIMTEDQRAEAEPFPDFPEPPEPPSPPRTPNLNDPQYAQNKIEEIIENQDPYDVVGNGIDVSALRPPVSPKSPSEPSDSMQKNNNNSWVVTTSANRNSRNVEDIPIPPVAPTLATLVNTDGYSDELKTAIQKYLQKNNALENAVEHYRKEKLGEPEHLWKIYNEAIKLYVAYYNLAQKEGNFVQPVPAFKERTKMDETNPPAPPKPPDPPKPKSPLELLKELEKDNVKVILDGQEIDYVDAETLFEENTFSRVNVRKGTEGRPVLEVSTD